MTILKLVLKKILEYVGVLAFIAITLSIPAFWAKLVSPPIIRIAANTLIKLPWQESPSLEISYFVVSHMAALIIYLPIVAVAVCGSRFFIPGKRWLSERGTFQRFAILYYLCFAVMVVAALTAMETW